MRVLGCDWPFMPMRTDLTPAASTGMRFWPVAITVSGRSTTTRAGESSALSLGVRVPFELISTRMSSVPRTTLTRSSWFGVCAAAAAATTISNNDTNMVTCCFRISPLPNPRAQPARPSENLISALPFPVSPSCLNCRREDSLHHFPREGFAQLVLDGLLKHDRATSNLHYKAVKHGVVLPQKISFIQIVGHDRDEAGVGLHHASQIDGADLQALLPG